MQEPIDIKELENRLKYIMNYLKETLALSVQLMEEDPNERKRVNKYWEDFLVHFLQFVRTQEKESGQNLLKGISLTRLIKAIK